jgi:16S rRNA (guanine(966)-N(2))-methyltransferase RsmD
VKIISGSLKGRNIKGYDIDGTRPTMDRVKESLFGIIQNYVCDSYVLDLFAGTGQLGIEALSRGANNAVFVDAREDACKIIRENLRRTKLEDVSKVVRSDYLDYLNRCREQYNIIFLDPPYSEVFLENSIKRITEIDILQTNGIIVAERPLGKELPWEFEGYTRSKDYKYSNTVLTIFRKD